MDDRPLSERIAGVERQGHALLALSAANMIMNLAIILLSAAYRF